MHRPLRSLVAAALLLAVAPPLAAYTIVLKDGSQVVARTKYRVDGQRAVFNLPNGTVSTLPLSEIDIPRTERANSSGNLGTAVVIDQPQEPTPPPQTPTATNPALSNYIRDKEQGLRELPGARRSPEIKPGTAAKTRAGFDDLFGFERSDYPDLEVASAIKAVYHRAGLTDAQIHRGTRADRALVEVITNSEASLFQALEIGAQALLEARTAHAAELAALELVMVTESRSRAGQFVLTPELAQELRDEKTDTAAFFVKHVQF